ncbi:hypothetical protein [Kineococcus sp. G2]|uniref:hypothetical protein n=1 Tax=Kineococcus sp. G2 TaxID=3127484 RepID=UPI00301D4D43
MSTHRTGRCVPRRRRVGMLAGVLAAAAGEVAACASERGRSPSSGLARGLVDAAPAVLVDAGVALVGRADKPGLAVLAAGASALAAAAGGHLAEHRPVLGAAVAGAPHALGSFLALRRGDASAPGTIAAAAVGVLVSATAVVPLRARPRPVLTTARAGTTRASATTRGATTGTAAAVGAAAMVTAAGASGSAARSGGTVTRSCQTPG